MTTTYKISDAQKVMHQVSIKLKEAFLLAYGVGAPQRDQILEVFRDVRRENGIKGYRLNDIPNGDSDSLKSLSS